MASLLYVDFQTDANFEERMEQLLRRLYNQPKFKKPALGKAPSFSTLDAVLKSTVLQSNNSAAPSVPEIINTVTSSNGSDWTYFENRSLYVYNDNPDITILHQENTESEKEFHESWTRNFPDPVAYRAIHQIFYRTTIVAEEFLVAVDGYRMYIPLPKTAMDLKISMKQYKFGKLINHFIPLGERYDEYLRRAGITTSNNA
jgi:hypothetical protein